MSKDSQAGQFEQRESGLKQELSVRLLGMIAIGQSIGTGLFLGSGISVQMAGPAVILSYVVGAVITLFVMLALSEMTAAHPMAGSFGAYAEHYLGPWAGWVSRYTYWIAQIVAIGSQIVASAIYCRYWFPEVPAWAWIMVFSAILLAVNVMHVGRFGEVEYWFSLIKVAAICVLLVFGALILTGMYGSNVRPENFTAHGGFFPRGLSGLWAGVTMAIFSFYGLEAASISSGEARDPRSSVPVALRRIMVRLAVFYIGSMTVLVGVMPWNQAGIQESPFVAVYRMMGIPSAAGIMNFVVLTAALSSLNSNVYTSSRMLFSLARSGQAPRWLGVVDRRGVPRNAILICGAGLAVAALVYHWYADTSFVYLTGVALFGAIFTWLMIMATHWRFRRWRRPYASAAGFVLLLAVLVTMAFLPEMRVAWMAGIPWLFFLSMAYLIRRRKPGLRDRPPNVETSP